MRDEKLLRELTQLWGVAGYEKEVRNYIEEKAAPYADDMMTDAVGNLIVHKKGTGGANAKKLMFAAHMDEIGFMVKKIEPDGRLRVCNLGWNWTGSAYNGRVRFRNGVSGVVSCMGPIEEAKNDPGKLYIDIGACSKEDAEKYVKLGDACGYHGEYLEFVNGRICAKTLDNRIGCYQLLEALKQNDGTGPNDIYYVFCVQEELGCRGSKVAAERIQPDIGVAVDITPAHDYPCDLEGSNEVDGGIGIKICDPSVVCDEDVVAAMVECCEKEQIKYQREVIDKGGTDASSMNLSGMGVKAGGIVVVTRYPHSQSAVASKADIEAGVDLIHAFSRREFT
ncbi:MAG: M42 family metallopeptidase [Lachnospiraceae bacterium]|jgi:putative aminopeptidase FrvX|nr:M42 family metallopeptidase [Lachnospiraceae bacterium]